MSMRPSPGARRVAVAAMVASFLAATALALPPLRPLDRTGRVTYFIADGKAGSTFQPDDRQLAAWAFGSWQRALNNALHFESAARAESLVQLFWVPARTGEFGETRLIVVNGHAGAAVYVRPDTSSLGPEIAQLARQDALFRDTVVYLTCVHEIGHALGLAHTRNFEDVMYAFGYGGDIPEFFKRYRRQLATRSDIARGSGLSPGDIAAVRALYR
jgi:hypothetical protein